MSLRTFDVEELQDAIQAFVRAERADLPEKEAVRVGVRRRGAAVHLSRSRQDAERLSQELGEIAADRSQTEGFRIARTMFAITEAGMIQADTERDETVARRANATAAAVIGSLTVASEGSIGLLEQCQESTLVTYLLNEEVPRESRLASLVRVCEDAVGRLLRTRGGARGLPRRRPAVGQRGIGYVGTPLSRVTFDQQQESLERALPVVRALRNAGYVEDVPGRDIAPGISSARHATDREEEAESSLMRTSVFVAVDAHLCALGLGYAIGKLETWGVPVLVLGDYPAGDHLARAYPGSLHGRWTEPTARTDDEIYSVTSAFLKAKAGQIKARNNFLNAIAGFDPELLAELHQRLAAADPFAFTESPLSHRRATFLTSDRIHYVHMTDLEWDALADLGFNPIARRPGRAVRQNTARQVYPAGRVMDSKSFQALQAFAEDRGVDAERRLRLLSLFYEPQLAVSALTGSWSWRDWERLAGQHDIGDAE